MDLTVDFKLLSGQGGSLLSMYWTYENSVHKYSKVHRAECSHCKDGRGTHDAVESHAGRWLGPFEAYGQAVSASKYEAESCGHCSPIGS